MTKKLEELVTSNLVRIAMLEVQLKSQNKKLDSIIELQKAFDQKLDNMSKRFASKEEATFIKGGLVIFFALVLFVVGSEFAQTLLSIFHFN